MAMDNRTRKMVIAPLGDICCFEDESEQTSHTSPASPTNLRYARSHAELAGRNSPPLSAGVSFTEKLETDDYWNWD